MKIKVISAIGGGAPIEVEIDRVDTIYNLKRLVSDIIRIPSSLVIMVFRGKQLLDEETVKSAGMEDGDKCYLITRTEGGFLFLFPFKSFLYSTSATIFFL